MSLPLNIDDLIHQRKVESARIEYKKDWNPEKVLYSVCAFANDIIESRYVPAVSHEVNFLRLRVLSEIDNGNLLK